jgi:hypothetical protein
MSLNMNRVRQRIVAHREAQRRYRGRLRERGAPDANALGRAALVGLREGVRQARLGGAVAWDIPELSAAIMHTVETLVDRGYARAEARRALKRALDGSMSDDESDGPTGSRRAVRIQSGGRTHRVTHGL